jgi:hypothetical protein
MCCAGGRAAVADLGAKFDRLQYFAERLGPTLAKALGPEFIEIDLAHSYAREPIA